jgi:hypothetical protein
MSVERGRAWGEPGGLPPDGIVVRSDAEARHAVERARRADAPLPAIGLLGGDLCRTLGGPGDEHRLRSADAVTVRVDVGAVLLDGALHWFVAHLIARRSWWWGRAVAVMNAEFLGPWDLGPRSHPGDGLLDVTDGTLPFGDRLAARRRARTGTHVPHPALSTRRVAAWQTELRPPLDVWLDGERVGRTSRLSVRVEPAALTVVV